MVKMLFLNKEDRMDEIICPACGNKVWKLFLNLSEFNLLECKMCGLKRKEFEKDFDNEKEDIKKWYDESYFKFFDDSPRQNWLKWQDMKFRLLKRYKKSGNFLDLGCGDGIGVELALRNGFDVWATDIAPSAGEWVKKRFNVPVFIGEVKDAPFSHNFFDVIYLHHVLEHIIEPVSFLKDWKQFLKDDGIFVISVPNIRSLYFKLYGKKFHIFQREHLWYFAPDTLSRILNNCEIETLEWKTGIIPETAVGWITAAVDNITSSSSPIKSPIGLSRRLWRTLPKGLRGKTFKVIHPIINFFISKIKKGDDLVVIARKFR